jgi:hypothetical protein
MYVVSQEKCSEESMSKLKLPAGPTLGKKKSGKLVTKRPGMDTHG